MRRIGLVQDPLFLAHQSPMGHPECVERLKAIDAALDQAVDGTSRRAALTPVPARPAERDEVAHIHTEPYLDALDRWRGQGGNLDPDTYISPHSVEAAYQAAGGGIELVKQIWSGTLQGGFALLRPPGHHAEADRGMGFCLLNHVAIAAAALRQEGAERVAIVDWDVHHGNGTQHSFERDPRVLYVSTHEYPFYPGTGAATEVGLDEGKGATVNLPFPAGFGDAEYIAAFDAVVLPILEQFRPDVILVSAGFDADARDPLAAMRVSPRGFGGMASRLRSAADNLCGGRIAYFLEGGYDFEALGAGVLACIDDMLTPQTPVPFGPPGSVWSKVHARIKDAQQGYWTL